MKLCFLLFLLFSYACFAQKQPAPKLKEPAVKATEMDSATYNFLLPVIKMIQVAEDPKKDPAFIMKDLKETGINGAAIYPAPYSYGSFRSTVQKTATDRTRQTTTWQWEAVFFETTNEGGKEIGESVKVKSDSLLKLLKYKNGSGPNSVGYISTSLDWTKKPVSVMVWLSFTKGIYNKEQQAFDSLQALYKPLLSKPAFAADAARQWGTALQVEGFDKDKITGWFQEILAELANSNSEAAFQMWVGIPDFMDYKAMLNKLPADKQSAMKEWAKKMVAEFYEAERRKVQGNPVVMQEKKIQTEKALNGCSSIPEHYKHKYQPGTTVISNESGTPFIARLTAVDCRTGTVTITKPGKRTAHDFEMKLPFQVYDRWQKYDKQFHRCTGCGGEGGERVTITERKTKELPQGYFSGIETKVTRTKTETVWTECYRCAGTGWVLE